MSGTRLALTKVIFIVTAPLLTHSVKINLPKTSSTRQELGARFAVEAKKQPQPELHIHAHRLAHYELEDFYLKPQPSPVTPGPEYVRFVQDTRSVPRGR